jgi:hypothetical protein
VVGEFIAHFMNVTAKLAGALGGIANGLESDDHGLTIALLKRILEILNETLTAAAALANRPPLAPERLAYYRAELFGIRENILALIARLRSVK